ncbi:MAG: AMP-binding protein, partial [Gammaproteobacteria bacterium]|nr:AMP-binding protein [Gammaproteobacteria bacterium]
MYRAEQTPGKPAWIFNKQVTRYEELAVSLLKGAQMFRKLGLQTGDGIAVLAENHPDSLALFWAAQTAGLYYTPISVQFHASEVEHILRDCDAKLLVTSETQTFKTISAPQAIRLSIENWRRDISAERESLITDACEGAEMLYSSGTTGHPKGVRGSLPGAALGTVSELFARRLSLHEIDSEAVYLSTAPLYHSAPLRYNNMMHRSGATSVIMERFDVLQSLSLIEKYRVTHSQWVPTMFVRLLRLPEDDRRAYDLSSHRLAIHAAAPCPVEIKRQMLDWWGPILHEYYSGAEGNGQTAISSEEWLRHPGSVGKPILGKLHITNEAGEELEPGETGTVYFSDGPRFEYYKDPGKTAEAYNHHGWSTLGDIGHVDEAGYLYLTDRASHMIISGGVNIYPREVEDLLVTHPAVQDAAVFGIPHIEFGEEVKAAVQLVDGEAVA